MGVENNKCIIATTWNIDAMEDIKYWIKTLPEQHQLLFSFVPSIVNRKETLFIAPSGSKKGWYIDSEITLIRDQLIAKINEYEYEDGSSPFSWVEVGFGEYGQKILKGNNKNCYSSSDYAE
jgi:hypothetical protein